MTFEQARRTTAWRPIPGCPGRYVRADGPTTLSPSELLGAPVAVEHHRSTPARDEVVVTRLVDGGLISYRQTDGRYVHTLADADGFARKLLDLGIGTLGTSRGAPDG